MSMIDLNLDQYWEAEFAKLREEIAGIAEKVTRVEALVTAQPNIDQHPTIMGLKTAVNTLITNAEVVRNYEQMVRNPPAIATPSRIM
jgi:hypothetical protein